MRRRRGDADAAIARRHILDSHMLEREEKKGFLERVGTYCKREKELVRSRLDYDSD